jgi:CheY-like chemotaxis protein
MRVLVIDNEGSIRDLIRMILEQVGYDVVTAESGEHGIRIFQANGNFDLVWTDWDMPGGMNGEMVIAEIRRLEPRQPIVLYTSTQDVLERLAKTPGDFTVLRKPAYNQDVRHAVAATIND